jgi:hypothetical protein
MEKFASLGGFGNIASARASIGRLLNKISNDQDASGAESPKKDDGEEGAAPVTPASKKKAGGRKRKVGESADRVHIERTEIQTDASIDAAAANDAEDESPTKKKASPTKRKSKAAAKATSEEEETPVKSEAGESADDDA